MATVRIIQKTQWNNNFKLVFALGVLGRATVFLLKILHWTKNLEYTVVLTKGC